MAGVEHDRDPPPREERSSMPMELATALMLVVPLAKLLKLLLVVLWFTKLLLLHTDPGLLSDGLDGTRVLEQLHLGQLTTPTPFSPPLTRVELCCG